LGRRQGGRVYFRVRDAHVTEADALTVSRGRAGRVASGRRGELLVSGHLVRRTSVAQKRRVGGVGVDHASSVLGGEAIRGHALLALAEGSALQRVDGVQVEDVQQRRENEQGYDGVREKHFGFVGFE